MDKNFISESTKWRLVDNHWQNVERTFTDLNNFVSHGLYSGTLADYLWLLGFDIPESVTYCLAQNNDFNLKYRVLGGAIHIIVCPLD